MVCVLLLEYNSIFTNPQPTVLINELFANFSNYQPTSLTIHLSQCVNTAIAIDSQWERLSAVTLGQA